MKTQIKLTATQATDDKSNTPTKLERAIECCKARSKGNTAVFLYQLGADTFEAYTDNTGRKGVFVAEFQKGQIARSAWDLADMARNAGSHGLQELKEMIAGTLKAFPSPVDRWQAMKAITWRMRGPLGQYVGLSASLRCAFVPEAESMIFSAQDNEDMKLAMYQMTLGPLTVEVLK